MSDDPKDAPLFPEPPEFGSVIIHEVIEPEGGWLLEDVGPPEYIDMSGGEFFRYRPKK